MGSEEELEALRTYASSTFSTHEALPERTHPLPRIDPQLLAKHIKSIEPHKAVPKDSAPAAAWKLCADEVSPSLSQFLTTVDTQNLPPGLLDADLCLIPKPGKPADKPAHLRPLGILRPDAKGVAGAARELLSPGLQEHMKEIPQFAYLQGRGLSDAHACLVQHLREVRQVCGTASPGRQELREGALHPDLVGGLTFALDLSQAFDTVSRQDIIDTLPELSDDPELVSLVHALHHRSAHRLTAQGDTAKVETTTGIKQGCKLAPSLFSLLTGKLFKELLAVFGEDRVCAFLTGYADDLTVHRTIRSVSDLEACHELIRALLESLKRHKLFCNSSKCYVLAKFAGRQAASVTKQYTAWTKDEAGRKVKLRRIGKTKYFPAFKWVSSIKFLGIKASYGSFEMQTLSFRISEAKQKLHQVRKFVYNRRVASTMSRLRVWQTVVWATLSFGLAEVGLSSESTRALRAWYAYKIRSVLNKPAHVTHMTTQELYDLYSIEDPVLKLERLQENRHARFCSQQIIAPSITSSAAAIQQSQNLLRNIRQFKHLPEPDAEEGSPTVPCPHCNRTFVSDQAPHRQIAPREGGKICS